MRIGAIDIGTNSMRLLIADYEDGNLLNREKFVNTTRIGEGVDKKGYISQEAIQRNIDGLIDFNRMCKDRKCEKVYCIGTSALRDSKNGDDFIQLAKNKADIDVEIISGKEESTLGFIGVAEGLTDRLKEEESILVLDIGGGSTEFILGNLKGIKFNKSENIGAVRMTEKFLKADPISEEEFKSMIRFIEEQINDTIEFLKNKKIDKVVGIGGTITSISAINQELETYSMEKIHNSSVDIEEVEKILQNLKKMTLNDKKNLKGLQPKRADIITSGVKILQIIMKKIEIKNIIVSEYDNLEGLICRKSQKMS
ncbi:Ppx/GppA phosphatase family protein [Asaccharospora irregularis]|uniref:Exopolyphosphatase / guanosine-5'-triphosphate,3'-diphosphate pyrophosphatase n=1 Tax=Asaccharospora irregularis DSM 2635 TaxID=1121321 RepID=A0A1M5S4N1_9FIRM|nr:Ppx/GppA phosphatase family protein [Asaccharospora irregularis]SHH33405.1 exopolyphosphatase / guanosine-5'-triphosphate,3'-diphosphate pyrophosphatase [Asaccharospora irregularis DSM 2635]